MTDQEIKPRIDEDGVGWCDAGCPQTGSTTDLGHTETQCKITGFHVLEEEVCPPWARRMAVENEAWRNGGLMLEGVADECSLDGEWFCTIDEAVDALMKVLP